jgi:hypothetical protein
MDSPSIAEQAEWPYISTGHLPGPETVQKVVSDAHLRFQSSTEGCNSQIYPARASLPSELFGVCVVDTGGRVHAAGDIEYELSTMRGSRGREYSGPAPGPKVGLLLMAGLAPLALIPAEHSRIISPGEIPADEPTTRARARRDPLASRRN